MAHQVSILYVEDDPMDQELVVRRLSKEKKFFIEIASTIGEAYNLLQEKQFDLILIDYKLPDGDGISLISWIKEKGISSPSIIITGRGDEKTAIAALKTGALDYISKQPGYLEKLPSIIDNVLWRAKEKRERLFPSLNLLYGEYVKTEIERVKNYFKTHAPYITIEYASTGPGCIHKFEEKSFDAVVVNYRMPGMSGIEILKHITSYKRAFPVIIIGSLRDEEAAVQSLKLGASDYIIKDKNYLSLLLHSVEQAVAQYRLINSERALRESEERYRQLLDNANDIIYLTDPKGYFIYINPAAEKNIGYTKEELIGRHCIEFIRHDYVSKIKRFYTIQLAKKIPNTYLEFPILTKEGEEIWLGQNVQLIIENEKVMGFQAVARDITKQIKAEEALRQTEKRYRTLVENSFDGIFIQKGSDIVFANQRLHSILGYEQGELVGMKHWQIYHPEFQAITKKHAADRMKGKDIISQYEVKLLRKDGSWFWGEVSARSITIDGEPGIQVWVKDITERKQAEEERERLFGQFLQAQKMEAIGTLAGGIAHDFNNLIQAILGYTQLLLLDKDPEEVDFVRLKEIEKAAKRASQLTEQLLTFSRKKESSLKPVSLNNLIREAEKFLKNIIPKMISMEFHLQKDLKVINADPDKLYQLIINLAINARDAMPEGGKLLFETKNIILDEEYCRAWVDLSPGEYVLFKIADTGVGIDQEIQRRMFEPFYTTKEIGKGTGLGLAMVYSIVKSHKGHIICHSAPSRGATFEIYLPVFSAKESSWGVSPPKEQELPRGGRETILLVDDEQSILDIGKSILEQFGYTILTAESGEEALRLFNEIRPLPDLVILDLNMPGMGGKKCLTELLRLYPETKIIVASGYLIEKQHEKSLYSQVKGFIRKPYELKEMLKIVREVLESK